MNAVATIAANPQIAEYAPAIAHAITSAHSVNTRRSYASQFKRFSDWAASAGVSHIPAAPEAVAAYLTTLADAGRSVSSIRLAASAIAFAHNAAGVDNPCEHAGVKAALKGLARLVGKPQTQAKALTSEALFAIAQTACHPRKRGRGEETAAVAKRRGLTDIALTRLLSDAGLRRSEAAAVRWTDITPAPDGVGGLVEIARSKTDADGAGEIAYITEPTMQALAAIRGDADADDPVFGLTPDAIHKRVKAAAIAAGLGEGYGGHSGRVGLAVRMAQAPTSAVMRQGRWASAAQVSRYQRAISATAAAAYLS